MRTSALVFASAVVVLTSAAACSNPPPPEEPSSPAAVPPSTAATGAAPSAPPAATPPDVPASTEAPAAGTERPTSRCGVGGTDRSRASSCSFVLRKDDAECCFEKMDDACREAGCAVDRCDLLKSMPPQVSCRK